tara:strand:- start:93 stop:506 length:414 start_codon:yes stop_codon:yes gene_type:complete
MKFLIASLVILSSCTPAVAAEVWEDPLMQQSGYSKSRTCYKSVYKEEYVPGTELDPGYVKTSKETIEVPCNEVASESKVIRKTVVEYDTNDCTDGTIAGALLGGGLAGFGSRGKDRWWAIPTGIIGGAMVGCQIDGG